MIGEADRFTVKKGVGVSKSSALNAVDKAMIDAEVGEYNLINVSSVLPKNIERVDEIDGDRGDFKPCVMSQMVGADKEVVAGIAYGFRDDGKGGYVVEHTACGENIDMKVFEKEMKDKLNNMGVDRGIRIEDIETTITKIKAVDGYGCALVVLVYLP